MGMGRQKYSFNTDFLFKFAVRYKPGYRPERSRRTAIGEESPDSTEQCTGEEPAVPKGIRDSATENDYLSNEEKMKT